MQCARLESRRSPKVWQRPFEPIVGRGQRFEARTDGWQRTRKAVVVQEEKLHLALEKAGGDRAAHLIVKHRKDVESRPVTE